MLGPNLKMDLFVSPEMIFHSHARRTVVELSSSWLSETACTFWEDTCVFSSSSLAIPFIFPGLHPNSTSAFRTLGQLLPGEKKCI